MKYDMDKLLQDAYAEKNKPSEKLNQTVIQNMQQCNTSRRRSGNMKKNFLWKSVAVIAASAALVVTANFTLPSTGISFHKTTESAQPVAQNSFVIKAYAQELTKGGQVHKLNAQTYTGDLCESEDNSISYAFECPFTCEGKNIKNITYSIKDGAFEISNPKDNSIVTAGEKNKDFINAPAMSFGNTKAGTGEEIPFDYIQYKSFTVDYNKQSDKQTAIYIVGDTDNWSKSKLQELKAINFDMLSNNLEKRQAFYALLFRDLGLSCTVTYKDGTTETQNIVADAKIMKLSELSGDFKEKDQKAVITCYGIE